MELISNEKRKYEVALIDDSVGKMTMMMIMKSFLVSKFFFFLLSFPQTLIMFKGEWMMVRFHR